MDFEDLWEELGFHVGPISFGMGGPMGNVRYSRTSTSHILRIRVNPDVKREEIKARLAKPGLIELEWPRRPAGEEIPVE